MKHIVGFSGGIDSQACALWVRNRYPKEDVILTNSTAGGWEDPLTQLFIHEYSRDVHSVVVILAKVSDMWETPGWAEKRGYDGTADLTFETMVKIKGRSPSRKAQFCTEKLKLVPQRNWTVRYSGQAENSKGKSTADTLAFDVKSQRVVKNAPIESHDNWYDCQIHAPIADWTKQMCFDYVKAHGEQINPLYAMGFNRVGCAPCINSGREDILMWMIKRPEMIDKVRRLEAETGLTFFAPMVPGQAINNIDMVLDWAMTIKRGGSKDQPAFPILLERPACESKYGLCE